MFSSHTRTSSIMSDLFIAPWTATVVPIYIMVMVLNTLLIAVYFGPINFPKAEVGFDWVNYWV